MRLQERLKRVLEEIENAKIRSGLTTAVTIVAVTKTHPASAIEAVGLAGITAIGENRIQEATKKFSLLSEGIKVTRRMIGHLQTNKVNKAIDLFHTIDTVDTFRLGEKINQRAKKLNIIFPVLLEINTSGEVQKQGFNLEDTESMLACMSLKSLCVSGLMTVGPYTQNKNKVRQSFKALRKLQEKLNSTGPKAGTQLTELSMGMSGDFALAIEEGSTMVRLGTALFGKRI